MLGVGASGSLRSLWPSPWGTSASSLAARRRGRASGALGAKTVAGDVRDADYLASTFAGADAVYTLTAFDPTLPDYHADQDRRGEAIASAIRQSGVRHVVALSALGGELASGNGFITSLHRQERRLRALDRVNLMILRPGAFFEGFYAALDTIRHEGVVLNHCRKAKPGSGGL